MRTSTAYVTAADTPMTGGARMRGIARALACIGVATVAACNAHAEIFKCTSVDGRILYSDAPCPPSSRGEVIVPDDNSSIAAPKPRPEAAPSPRPGPEVQPAPKPRPEAAPPPRPEAAPPPRPGPEVQPAPKPRPEVAPSPRPGPEVQPVAAAASDYDLSLNERQRVGNLEQIQRSADNAEKREAARMEIQEIRRGTLARMSLEDQHKKDGVWADLGNVDRQRRIVAVRQLADLFAAYR